MGGSGCEEGEETDADKAAKKAAELKVKKQQLEQKKIERSTLVKKCLAEKSLGGSSAGNSAGNARVDCTACVVEFDKRKGCVLWKSDFSGDPTKAIPTGCTVCEPEAKTHCAALTKPQASKHIIIIFGAI